MTLKIFNPSAAGVPFKRVLLENAVASGDPVTGGKFVSLTETPGDAGVTTVVVKNGLTSTADREPDNQPYWMIDVSDDIKWDENQNIEVLIEVTTPTSSGDDVMSWCGIASDTNQANWSSRASFYGYRHSVVFKTDPMHGAWNLGSLFYTTQADANSRHLYSQYHSPKNEIKRPQMGGLRKSDWSMPFPADIRGAAPVFPNATSDPAYLCFTAGSMRNVALGSGSNVSFSFRLWYRAINYEP